MPVSSYAASAHPQTPPPCTPPHPCPCLTPPSLWRACPSPGGWASLIPPPRRYSLEATGASTSVGPHAGSGATQLSVSPGHRLRACTHRSWSPTLPLQREPPTSARSPACWRAGGACTRSPTSGRSLWIHWALRGGARRMGRRWTEQSVCLWGLPRRTPQGSGRSLRRTTLMTKPTSRCQRSSAARCRQVPSHDITPCQALVTIATGTGDCSGSTRLDSSGWSWKKFWFCSS